MTSALSLLEGGPLAEPGVDNLAAALVRAARRTTRPAVCHVDEHGAETWTSYPRLLADATAAAHGLAARPGEVVALHLPDGPDLLVAFWACVLAGAVPVPLTTRLTGAARDEAWRALGSPRLLTALPDAGAGDRALPGLAAGADDLALLTLTAGSSGAPKAVRLSHRNVLARAAGSAHANQLSSASVTVNWMPLDHVSGLVMFHVRDVFLACTQVHLRTSPVRADPLRWLDALDRFGADTTWATNSSFDLVTDRLAEAGERRWDLRRLRYVMNGGEPVRARTLRRFLAATAPFGVPATAMRPGWGMSETAAGVVDHRFHPERARDGDRYVPVGRPHPGVALRVVDGADRVLPVGVVGQLQVRGAPITSGYLTPVPDAFTPDGWFRTGDLGFVRDGELTVTGSADDLIAGPPDLISALPGLLARPAPDVVHGHELRAALADLPFLAPAGTVPCTVPGPDRTPELVVFAELATPATPATEQVTRAITERVRDRFGLVVDHVVPLAAGDIPTSGTGKPRRADLRALFQRTR